MHPFRILLQWCVAYHSVHGFTVDICHCFYRIPHPHASPHRRETHMQRKKEDEKQACIAGPTDGTLFIVVYYDSVLVVRYYAVVTLRQLTSLVVRHVEVALSRIG